MATEPASIDETPISPVRQAVERRNSLEKHLQHRPEPQDLKNRHILLDTTTAPFVNPLQSLSLAGPPFADELAHYAPIMLTGCYIQGIAGQGA
jgi:hypothetical protein